MPDHVRSLDRITILNPCNVNWDQMIGNDQVRFCEHCNLHVTDLSSMTRQAAMRLVARSQGRLCVRFVQRPNGGVLTRQMAQELHQIGRRVSRVAAGAFTATLSFASAVAQTGQVSSQNSVRVVQRLTQEKSKTGEGSAKVTGRVTDPNGAVVPGATVTLINLDSNSESNTTTSVEGEYVFENPSLGAHKIRISSPGFEVREIADISLGVNSTSRFDVTLEVGEIRVTMGILAIVEPEEPLVKAASRDDLAAVEQLAFACADVNVRDKNINMTALHLAVANNNLEIVRTLLRAGAKVNVKNEGGRTPLMYIRDKTSVELVRELISAGAKVNTRDESGGTALMIAAGESKYEVVKELLEAGARINRKDASGKTALMFAATNKDIRIAKVLIDFGAEIDATDEEGNTALMLAAEEGEPAVVKLLISFQADVNAIDNKGRSALMRVAGTSDLESAQALLNAGADVNVRDKEGKTALTVAREARHQEMITLLESRGAPE